MSEGMTRLLTFLCLIVFAAGAAPLQAQSLDDAYHVRILPGWRAADGTHVAAVEVTLAEGWKTYWRAPGDAGIPPQFDWRESSNLAGVDISWPTPKAISQNGLQAIGYSDRMILPLRVMPSRKGKTVQLSGSIEMGVCKDVCIPVTADLWQVLAHDVRKPDAQIAAALADRPYSADEAGVGRVACVITSKADGLHLRAEIDLPHTGGREVTVVETDNPLIWVAQAEARREGGRLIAETELYHTAGHAFAVNRSGIRIPVLGTSHAVDIQGCPSG
jgi:hypothetical protein